MLRSKGHVYKLETINANVAHGLKDPLQAVVSKNISQEYLLKEIYEVLHSREFAKDLGFN
jgi:hypothetical protein